MLNHRALHQSDSHKAAGCELGIRKLGPLSQHSVERAHIIGDTWTIADAYAFPMLRWVRSIPLGGLEDYQSAGRFLDQIEGDSTAQAVLEADQSAAPD